MSSVSRRRLLPASASGRRLVLLLLAVVLLVLPVVAFINRGDSAAELQQRQVAAQAMAQLSQQVSNGAVLPVSQTDPVPAPPVEAGEQTPTVPLPDSLTDAQGQRLASGISPEFERAQQSAGLAADAPASTQATEGEGSLSGRVADPDGSPIEGACVEVYGDSSTTPGPTATDCTDASGRYDLPALPLDTYFVEVLDAVHLHQSFADQVVVDGVVSDFDVVLQPGGAVAGEVTDTEGTPLAGICISIHTETENSASFGRDCTDEEGRFQTSGVAPGTAFLEYFDEEGQYLSHSVANVPVRLGEVTTAAPVELTLGGWITGTVTDAQTGAPVEGMCLSANSQVGGSSGGGCTDATGRFTTTGLQAGDYSLHWYSNGRYLTPTGVPQTATVELGEPTTLDATARVGATISGRVMAQDTGLPLAGVTVNASSTMAGRSATTDADGNYTIAGLPYEPTAYRVWFSSYNNSGYMTQYYDGAASWSDADQVTLTSPAGATGIDAQLVRGAVLSGVVRAADGSPLSSASITVYNQASPTMSVAYGNTDTQGRYSTTALPTGTYLVRFADNSGRYVTQYWQNAATPEAATPIQATAGTDVGGIDATLREGLTISGRVTSAVDGKTPRFVQVSARNTDTGVSTVGYAQSDGTYTVPGLAAGNYVVSFTDTASDSIFRTQWYDGADSAVEATPVVLTDAPATGIDAALRAGSYIAGTITGQDGRPLPGACANLYRADSTTTVVRTSCADGSGNYRLGGAGTGNFLVRFTAPNTDYVSTWYGGALTADQAAIVSVPDGGQVDGVDGRLGLGGRISGMLTRPAGTSACAYVYPADGWQSVSMSCVYSAGPSAQWTSEALPAGEYVVSFHAWGVGSGSVSRWYDGVTTKDEATRVPVTVSETTSGIDGELPNFVTVTGRLTDSATGAPLGSACVAAQAATTGSYGGSTCTVTDGVWTLALQPGDYTFYFTAAGYETQWWDGATSAAAATTVTVSSDVPPSALDAALTGGAATLSGRLTDADTGDPVEGACVRWSSSSPSSTEGCSDASGAYSVSVPAGTYFGSSFWVEDPADLYASTYLPLSGTDNGPVELAPGQTINDVDAELQVGGRLTATVTSDNNGVPLSGVCLQLSGTYVFDAGYACTDANGNLRTKALPPGDFTVQFVNYNGRYAAEYFDDVASFESATAVAIASGQVRQLTVSLGLGGGLSGRLTLPGGAPAVDACVLLTPLAAENGDPVRACTDATGRWNSPGLRAGEWIVGATAPGWASTWYEHASTAKTATPVTVEAGTVRTGIDIEMRNPQPTISGVVSDREGQPVEGVCAYLYTGWDTYTGRAWCTGADGIYKFTADAGETYKVGVSDPTSRFRTTWYGNVPDQADATLIAAPGDGSEVTADITLALPTVVTASVQRNGTAVGGICGYLYPVGSDAAALGTCTGDDGTLTFSDVPDGDYVLGASDTRGRYATVWSGGAASREDAAVVTVAGDGELSLGTLDLSPAQPGGGLLVGVVTDAATGAPIADVCGYLRTPDGQPAGYATCTVADGSYAVEVPTGDYSIVFSDPSARYTTQSFGDVLTVAESEITTADLQLSPVRRIEGRIVDQDGEPVAGMCVYAYDDGGSTAGAFCTDSDGRWTIAELDAGSYRIGAMDTAGGHQTVWAGGSSLDDAAPVPVSDETPVASVGDLTTIGLGAASGRVLDGDGAPMADVCIYVDRADGSYAGVGTCTGPDGTYWLGPLPEGQYTVAYYPPGVAAPTPHWYDGAPDEASADRVQVTAGETVVLNDQTF